MNTGLALRKPLESSQGAAHRFLVANAAIPTAALMQSLKTFAQANEFHSAGYYSVLAQRWEQQFCQQYQLPYYPPEPVPSSTSLRNCARCAAIGYHSMAYQWAWLTHCPVHHTPLTDECPACHRPWPSISELLQRYCPGCGWPIHREQLWKNLAFTNAWLAMETLCVIRRDYQSLTKVRLTTGVNFRHALDEHQSVTLEHPDFASVYARQIPSCHAQLLAGQTSLQPVTCFRFPLQDGVSHRCPASRPEAANNLWPVWRRQVDSQVLRAIEDYRKRPLTIPLFYDIEFEGIDADTDIYRLAYIYWRKLVHALPGQRQPRSRYFDTYPLIPVPMSRLALAADTDHESGFLLPSLSVAPLELVHRVYELDLWWCFKSLLVYFDALKANRDSINPAILYRALPAWAWPGRDYNYVMGIFVNPQRELELIIPAARLSYSLEDLALPDQTALDQS